MVLLYHLYLALAILDSTVLREHCPLDQKIQLRVMFAYVDITVLKVLPFQLLVLKAIILTVLVIRM
jgi:hypothetical protein